jgi:protein-ribulosamine 3-kinase
MPDWSSISSHIRKVCGESLQIDSARSIGGGCINAAYTLDTGSRQLFIKINTASNLAMFEAEAEGLAEIAQSRTIRVPEPLCCGVAGNDAYLVMENLKLTGAGNPAKLGENLADMHRVVQTMGNQQLFGWHRDNTIGSTPQINDTEQDWITFWSEHRLGYQLKLASQRGAGSDLVRKGELLQEKLIFFFGDHLPEASLLHGDLWSGNFAYEQGGLPVIYDPAIYYGDRETDIAMTELFGGFSADFYAAYSDSYPLDSGYPTRKTLYNLYHILNHYNLFGGGYQSQAASMIDRLLSECG